MAKLFYLLIILLVSKVDSSQLKYGGEGKVTVIVPSPLELEIKGEVSELNLNYKCLLVKNTDKSNATIIFYDGVVDMVNVYQNETNCYYASNIFGSSICVFKFPIVGEKTWRNVQLSIRSENNGTGSYHYFDEPIVEKKTSSFHMVDIDGKPQWGQIDIAVVVLPDFFRQQLINRDDKVLEQTIYASVALANLIWSRLHLTMIVRHVIVLDDDGFYKQPIWDENLLQRTSSFGYESYLFKYSYELYDYQNSPQIRNITDQESLGKNLTFVFLHFDGELTSGDFVGHAWGEVSCK